MIDGSASAGCMPFSQAAKQFGILNTFEAAAQVNANPATADVVSAGREVCRWAAILQCNTVLLRFVSLHLSCCPERLKNSTRGARALYEFVAGQPHKSLF